MIERTYKSPWHNPNYSHEDLAETCAKYADELVRLNCEVTKLKTQNSALKERNTQDSDQEVMKLRAELEAAIRVCNTLETEVDMHGRALEGITRRFNLLESLVNKFMTEQSEPPQPEGK